MQSSFTIVTMDTVPYAVCMNRIYNACVIDRRQGSHGVLASKLMLEATKTTMMKFLTARKIIVLILVVKTVMSKTMLNYIPNERTRLGRSLKKLFDKTAAGLKA